MRSSEMATITSRALRCVIAAVFVALTVTACDISSPDPAACKAAMQAQYVRATAGQGHFGTVPKACKGLPKSEVQMLARQVLEGK
jgi:hypothetical protein